MKLPRYHKTYPLFLILPWSTQHTARYPYNLYTIFIRHILYFLSPITIIYKSKHYAQVLRWDFNFCIVVYSRDIWHNPSTHTLTKYLIHVNLLKNKYKRLKKISDRAISYYFIRAIHSVTIIQNYPFISYQKSK